MRKIRRVLSGKWEISNASRERGRAVKKKRGGIKTGSGRKMRKMSPMGPTVTRMVSEEDSSGLDLRRGTGETLRRHLKKSAVMKFFSVRSSKDYILKG